MTANNSMSNSISCPICNNLCSSQAVSCPRCGHPFQQTEKTQKFVIPYPVLMIFKTLANLSFALALISGTLLVAVGFVKLFSGNFLGWLLEKGIWIIPFVIVGAIFYGLFTLLIHIGKRAK